MKDNLKKKKYANSVINYSNGTHRVCQIIQHVLIINDIKTQDS